MTRDVGKFMSSGGQFRAVCMPDIILQKGWKYLINNDDATALITLLSMSYSLSNCVIVLWECSGNLKLLEIELPIKKGG